MKFTGRARLMVVRSGGASTRYKKKMKKKQKPPTLEQSERRNKRKREQYLDPAFRAEYRRKQKEWRDANPDKVRLRNKRQRLLHGNKIRAADRERYAKKKEGKAPRIPLTEEQKKANRRIASEKWRDANRELERKRAAANRRSSS
jgi:hypothetical protein